MDDINLPKRKYTKDNEEAAKRRAARRQGHEAPTGKLSYSCETMEEIQEINLLLQRVKTFLGGGNPNLCTNKQLLSEVFRFYIAKNIEEYGPERNNTDSAEPAHFVDCSFAQCTDLPSTKEQLFVCASSSIDNLVKHTQLHSKVCDQPLETNAVTLSGHVGVFRLQCAKDHRISWHSSPYLGDKYLVNSRMAHGYFISGILPNQYERIMTATGIGILGNAYLNTFFESYSECVKALAKESTRDALLEEIVTYEDMDGINILTDARHATRKNSKYTDVICLGANSHKVLHYETVTRGDDPCEQRHESLGTQRIYDHLQSQENGVYTVMIETHL